MELFAFPKLHTSLNGVVYEKKVWQLQYGWSAVWISVLRNRSLHKSYLAKLLGESQLCRVELLL